MTKKKVAEAKEDLGTTVKNCTFWNQVQWDGQAVEAVHTVAAALLENAKAARALADVFASQNIRFEPIISIRNHQPEQSE